MSKLKIFGLMVVGFIVILILESLLPRSANYLVMASVFLFLLGKISILEGQLKVATFRHFTEHEEMDGLLMGVDFSLVELRSEINLIKQTLKQEPAFADIHDSSLFDAIDEREGRRCAWETDGTVGPNIDAALDFYHK